MPGLADGAILKIRLTPRSSKDRLLGWDGETLRIALTAPPVDDQANKSLVRFLAKSLGVSPSGVAIERGRTSRLKTVSIRGLAQDELERKLGEALEGRPA